MSEYILVVLTNSVAGRDDEFNSWYDDQHIGDLLGLPGLVAARRYRLAEEQFDSTTFPTSPYRYLATYEIETDDPRSVMDALEKTRTTLPMTDAMAASPMGSWLFEPLSGRRTQ